MYFALRILGTFFVTSAIIVFAGLTLPTAVGLAFFVGYSLGLVDITYFSDSRSRSEGK